MPRGACLEREAPKGDSQVGSPHKGQSTEAVRRGGTTRSSDEVPETGWSQGVVLWCFIPEPTKHGPPIPSGKNS